MTDTVLYPCYIIMTEFSLFFGSILFPKNVANFTTHCILEWKKKRFCATKETRVQCNCIHITYLYFVEAHMFFWRIYIFMLVAGYSDSNRGGWFYINYFTPPHFVHVPIHVHLCRVLTCITHEHFLWIRNRLFHEEYCSKC